MGELGSRWGHIKHGSERDAPWWYNERTSVGFLAGSVWHTYGEAVEEYVADKRYRTRRGKKVRPGRGDLMFTLNPGRRVEQWFVAEAKHLEMDIMKKDVSRIGILLKQARDESVCSPNYSEAKRIGVLFVAPYKKGTTKDDGPSVQEIRRWVDSILTLQKRSNMAVAWIFPAQTRSLSWHSRSDKAYYFYPGAALFVKRPRST